MTDTEAVRARARKALEPNFARGLSARRYPRRIATSVATKSSAAITRATRQWRSAGPLPPPLILREPARSFKAPAGVPACFLVVIGRGAPARHPPAVANESSINMERSATTVHPRSVGKTGMNEIRDIHSTTWEWDTKPRAPPAGIMESTRTTFMPHTWTKCQPARTPRRDRLRESCASTKQQPVAIRLSGATRLQRHSFAGDVPVGVAFAHNR